MKRYEETEDRKILRLRDTEVLEIRATPNFYLRLTKGVEMEFSGIVLWKLGGRVAGPAPMPLSELPADDLAAAVTTRPLSWVIFNSGNHRIVLSNAWHLRMTPAPGDNWRIQLGDGTVFTYPHGEDFQGDV